MPYNPHVLSPCCRRRFIPCWRSRSPSPNKGQHIHSTKKRWWPETSHQPKNAQLSCEVRTLQDGDSPYSEIPSQKGRLYDQGRLERCLLYGTNGQHSSVGVKQADSASKYLVRPGYYCCHWRDALLNETQPRWGL